MFFCRKSAILNETSSQGVQEKVPPYNAGRVVSWTVMGPGAGGGGAAFSIIYSHHPDGFEIS